MIKDDLNINQHSEHLNIRCPKCFKLYSVDSAELNEAKPKFECLDCQQKFWVPYPEALEQASGLIGFPLEWLEEAKETAIEPEKIVNPEPQVEQKPFSCPKCQVPYDGGESECKSCGVIFERIIDIEKQRKVPEASVELKKLWGQVVEAYDREDYHESFIALAQTEKTLSYALYQYDQLLELIQLLWLNF